jgi:hypothetical protein
MKVTFLGTTSNQGGSPTLWATDRDTLIVRGYAITDPEALAGLGDVPTGEHDIEIPRDLLRRFYKPDEGTDDASESGQA